MNKKTIAITAEQYKTIIATMKQGFSGCRPNERIATALILEANLGLRISDIVKLRLADIVHDGDRYRLSIVEQKTRKARTFTVPLALYQFIRCYCLDHNISPEARIFPITSELYRKGCKAFVPTWGTARISARTASESSMQQRFTTITVTTLSLSSSSYSTVPPQSHKGTSASSSRSLKRLSRVI